MITAPFNFVPLSEEVFFPDWAEDVSHDIPFEDGESGSIDITITAKSPLFIRNHSNDKDTPSEEFCNYNGEYYIPSASVKGMVRNVLEIMSFSKMNQFDDDTYAVRDLSDANNFYMKEMKKDTFCGWLKKDGDSFVIEDCGKAGRIKHSEIDKVFNIDFSSQFKKGNFSDKANDKMALVKYQMIKDNNFTHTFEHTTTSTVGDKRYSYSKSSSTKGTIVLTGQPSARDESRKPPSGKVYEFIFFEPKKDIQVSNKSMNNFLFAYFDKRTTQPKESEDWTFWKKKLSNGEKVPVFFQKNGSQIAHFGLSYLYKLPYKHSIKDGVPKEHNSNRADLAETLFGFINSERKTALKGRVQFSHFKATKNIKELKSRTEILGTPRASYYPIYVKQNGDTLFTTFMDNNFALAGRKRYPIHRGSSVMQTEDTGNDKVGTTFKPLDKNIIFQGKVHFHNLKKVELGALLSALTFHNSKECYHNIGMAKSLGYGKIEIKLEGVKDLNSYLKAFEVQMSTSIDDWGNSDGIKELFTMAKEQQNSGNSQLKYMSLKSFSDNKTGQKDYLRPYSQLTGIKKVSLLSLVDSGELEVIKERDKVEKEQKIFNDTLSLVSKSDNITLYENFIEKYSDYEKIEEIVARKEKLQKAQESNKFEKVDAQARLALQELEKKKSNQKQYAKLLDKFIKKWSASKNNKGSIYIQELILTLNKRK